VQQFLTVISDL